MGQVPSTISCDPSTPEFLPDGPGLYSTNDRLFSSHCQFDTTGPVLSITQENFYDCIISCGANTRCKAISWNHGTCYQKSLAGDLVANDGVSSFVSFDNTDWSCPNSDGNSYYAQNDKQFIITCGTDWPGVGDLSSSNQPTFNECIDDCANTDKCVAVAYSGTGCYKKSAIGTVVPNPGLAAAYLSNMPPPADEGVSCPASNGKTYTAGGATYTIKCGADYFGGDLTSLATANFAECIAACDNNEKCIDVSYTHGSCYLKDKVNNLVPNENVWTALSDRQPADPDRFSCPSSNPYTYTTGGKDFTISCSTDYYGGDFASLDTDTMQGCVDACGSHESCLAVAYRGRSCYLKSTLLGFHFADANVRGAKVTETPPPTPLDGDHACAKPYTCNGPIDVSCSANPASCNCFRALATNTGFCSSATSCNSECHADADCGDGKVCLTETCCPNSNGSVCVDKVDATCANTAAPRYLFARMKRNTIYNGLLGQYVDVAPTE